jgi:hypothetical protein
MESLAVCDLEVFRHGGLIGIRHEAEEPNESAKRQNLNGGPYRKVVAVLNEVVGNEILLFPLCTGFLVGSQPSFSYPCGRPCPVPRRNLDPDVPQINGRTVIVFPGCARWRS